MMRTPQTHMRTDKVDHEYKKHGYMVTEEMKFFV